METSPQQPYSNSIFWIELGKIKPNPYQPRREFDEVKLRDLADSIRQYGILQPLVVTRKEVETSDGGLRSEYELIAGERRLRAAKLAGIIQAPVIIREGSSDEESERIKLEIAIIENIQREDLNPVDRARAFKRLAEDFGHSHIHIARRVGKSREYVSNSIRMLALPEEIIQSISEGKITEGHTRPLLMLVGRQDEQMTLFKDIIYKKLTVREAEEISRHIAFERARKRTLDMNPEILEIERQFASSLGTRVHIQCRDAESGGRVMIDFTTTGDLRAMLERLMNAQDALTAASATDEAVSAVPSPEDAGTLEATEENAAELPAEEPVIAAAPAEVAEAKEADDLYSVRNFTI
ncbi:MAG: ParB/RepB/Spo0J family partition protein [Parcubacteria group bacterium]|nr:ParB/RepB/Spo0J family partition protein [Parcubacteria group bacterium]